ncbi:cytochrome P450 [Aestuariivita sp.]|jgi:unspecific monooxygenase|uniref:cytochrome P450 n=1 Tax=Aestuariivita sp. TaxID=1872407 RepID=UPI002172AD8A|nr:cytochrome P450 [Aestuariivita sp.]MCE8007912.1 cytochrome P450 [Aestuariivita sp.]
MQRLSQSPTDPAFVQDPYAFYTRARAAGELIWWQDYAMPAAPTHRAVHAILRDKRFGRECPSELCAPVPDHLAPFWAIEQHSMLDAEPPRHTRLRGQVLRAFTSRRIAALAPEIAALCDQLIDRFPAGPFDLLPAYCTDIPVIIIARLLGVPDTDAPQLLGWSHAMVAIYQAGRDRTIEEAAASAAKEFADYLKHHIALKRRSPGHDLLSTLVQATDADAQLSEDELIGTAILLLNAGHEATVHALGNAVRCLLSHNVPQDLLDPERIATTVEELLRLDPPLHLFTRYAYEPLTLFGHGFARGDQVALLLASANRDPIIWPDPDRFLADRPSKTHHSFGGGLHFCVGAPLARREMQIALPRLFQRCPKLQLAGPATYADTYHFHGLKALMVQT